MHNPYTSLPPKQIALLLRNEKKQKQPNFATIKLLDEALAASSPKFVPSRFTAEETSRLGAILERLKASPDIFADDPLFRAEIETAANAITRFTVEAAKAVAEARAAKKAAKAADATPPVAASQ